jgi:hypothetical protein
LQLRGECRIFYKIFFKKVSRTENSGDLHSMSTSSDPQKSPSVTAVELLKSLNRDGKRYERSATVLTELGRILSLPQYDWIAEAEHLQNETLVFLIRKTRRGDPEVYGCLFQELITRITRHARRWVWGLDPTIAEEIVSKVEIDIMNLVLAQESSRKTEVLEVAFARAVKRRTVNAARNHKGSPMGRRGRIQADATDEDGDEIERPIELVADDRPGPQTILLETEDEARRPELIRKLLDAVKHPQQREALDLHYLGGLPITSRDPGKTDLVRRLQATSGQIKHRIAAGLKAIRKAIGEKK